MHPVQAISDSPVRGNPAPVSQPPMRIGFCGITGAGKSEAARHLIERHNFQRGKFAGALKAMLRALLAYRGVDSAMIERMVEGDFKESPTAALNGRSPRQAMETLGTEWGRQLVHRDIWINTEMDAKASIPCVVFDDVRYENEAEAIRNAGGALIRIIRPGQESKATAGHTSAEYRGHVDYLIVNDVPLADFLSRVDVAIQSVAWIVATRRA